jgi:hypothetical protein
VDAADRPRPRRWTKVDAIRMAWQAERPDLAAEQAAEEFERAAIPVPAGLLPDESMRPWRARIYSDAASLYRTLVIAGTDGVLLARLEIGCGMGHKRYQDALKVLRASGEISESRERLPDRAGYIREQVVLRAPVGRP